MLKLRTADMKPAFEANTTKKMGFNVISDQRACWTTFIPPTNKYHCQHTLVSQLISKSKP